MLINISEIQYSLVFNVLFRNVHYDFKIQLNQGLPFMQSLPNDATLDAMLIPAMVLTNSPTTRSGEKNEVSVMNLHV